ncbi:aldehyde-activating protein [Nostoc sp. 3335mG]|nr:aldehyde-activating protein [Nostoc sp. 3335mG]
MTLEGGCYCGAVRYRMEGDPICVNGCHCRDCQTLTGAAFAVNAMIEADWVTLTKGEPATDEFGTKCGKCGALLWATHPMFGDNILFLRAGTLDESDRMTPDIHFFVRSKHQWIALPEGVPFFETLPGKDETLFTPAQQARVAAAMQG